MELLITVAGLLVAIYTIIPRERRLDLRLRLGGVDWLTIAIVFLLVLYLEFYQFFEAVGLAAHTSVWPSGITPQNSIYLVILAAVLLLALRVRFTRLTTRKIWEFHELVEELFWGARFGELLSLMQTHGRQLFRIYHADFALSRLRGRLLPSPFEGITALLKGQGGAKRRGSKYLRIPKRILQRIAVLLPAYERESETARQVLRTVFLSPRSVQALVRTRPYLALEIIRCWSGGFERPDFVSLYMEELLKDPLSVFYVEVANNQNLSASNRYAIPESNRLLYFLFADAKVAEELGIYKPVGDYVLRHLDEIARDPQTDPYNRALQDFEKRDAWHSPLFVGIRFFDIMVMEALYQGIAWHMWLYYFPLIVEKMVRNYRVCDTLSNPTDEFPNRYSRVLYEMFDALRNWTLAIKDLPLGHPSATLRSTTVDHENANIPKSSILAFSECLRSVVESENIGKKFRDYMLDIAFRFYFELRKTRGGEDYATVLFQALVQGGIWLRRTRSSYHSRALTAFKEQEMEYRIEYSREEVSKLGQALQEQARG